VNKVASNGKMWIAVGESSGTDGVVTKIAYSYNGVDWEAYDQELPVGVGKTIYSSGSRWYIGGELDTDSIYYLNNNEQWTPVTTTDVQRLANVKHITSNESIFVAGGTRSLENSNILSSSYDGINWVSRTIPAASSRIVAVGSGTNAVMYSDNNGVTWNVVENIFVDDLTDGGGNGAAFNGSRWVVVGRGVNTIAYSDNGENWTGLGTIFTTGNAVASNGSTWVVVGSGGNNSIAYSNDNAVTWNFIETSIFSSQGNDVAWNGSMWVAVGAGNNSIAYSYDGITWIGSGTSIFSDGGRGVAWNGSIWVAVGQGTANRIAYSYDGINWTGLGTSILSNPSEVAWNGIMWLAGGTGNDKLAYSYDGISWENISIDFDVYSIVWNGIHWVIGTSGITSGITSGAIKYSANAQTWQTTSDTLDVKSIDGIASETPLNPLPNGINDIAWNGSMWVAGGQGNTVLSYSTNGRTWVNLGILLFRKKVDRVFWNNSMWFALGGIYDNKYYLAYSYDGINWFDYNINNTSEVYSLAFSKLDPIIDIKHPIIALGHTGTTDDLDTIQYSKDGFNWRSLGSLFTRHNDSISSRGNNIKWNGLMWVGVGQGDNQIIYSYDGIQWRGLGEFFSPGTFRSAICLEWNGKMWVVGGLGAEKFLYSYDGINWISNNSSDNIFTEAARDIVWNGKRWIAVGSGSVISTSNYMNDSRNRIAVSDDGINWQVLREIVTFTNSTGGTQQEFKIPGTVPITTFTQRARCISANQHTIVAGGERSNSISDRYSNLSNVTLIYSRDNGDNWHPAIYTQDDPNDLFSGMTMVRRIVWNGSMWVAVGQVSTTPTIVYSYDGIYWTRTKSISNTSGLTGLRSLGWTGKMWIAGGEGGADATRRFIYSFTGINWYSLQTSTNFASIKGISTSYGVGILKFDNQIIIDKPINNNNKDYRLDIVNDSYKDYNLNVNLSVTSTDFKF
jgi:hypothetical protein